MHLQGLFPQILIVMRSFVFLFALIVISGRIHWKSSKRVVVAEDLVSYGSTWKYTNNPQASMDWTTAAVNWPEISSFPSVTTIIRYFRKTVVYSN